MRAALLVVSALGAGMLLVIGGFVVHIRGEWEDDAPLTAAVAAMLVVDIAGLVLGGSFWRDYLFPLLPATALCAALLARRRSKRGVAMRAVIAAAAASTLLLLAGWAGYQALGLQEFDEVDTGEALHEVAEPGDTLVVFGGRADLQLTSGMASPYEHLWSLPMRTIDPELGRPPGPRRRTGRPHVGRRVAPVHELVGGVRRASWRTSSRSATSRTASAAAGPTTTRAPSGC